MLSALKNLKSKTQKKAKELVSTITHGQGVSKSIGVSKKVHPVNFGYIEGNILHNNKIYKNTYQVQNEKTWKQLQEIENFIDNSDIDNDLAKLAEKRNLIDHLFGEDSIYSNNIDDKSMLLTGEFPMKVIEEIHDTKNDKIKFAALEENLDEHFVPFPVVRLAIAGKDPIHLRDFLEANKCKEYGIDAVTMCSPDENKTRGVRLELCEDEDGQEIRSYEILNGTYDMDITWEVEGKKCEMKISVSADGSAKILKRNGVTDEEIYAHTEVMVGKQHDTKFLYEALGLNQGKSTERIKPTLHKRSEPKAPEGAKIKELVEKDPEVKSALKEFASEIKEESSESMKPLTDITKADVKGAGSSIQR